MSRRRRVDRGKVTERTVDGEAGRRVGDCAQDLGNLARVFAIDLVGPVLSPDRRAAILHLGAQGHPVEVVIRLNPPRHVSLQLAGVELCRAEFDTLQ